MQKYLRPTGAIDPDRSVIMITDDGYSIIQNSAHDDDDAPMVVATGAIGPQQSALGPTHRASAEQRDPALLAALTPTAAAAQSPSTVSRNGRTNRKRHRATSSATTSRHRRSISDDPEVSALVVTACDRQPY
jgi:hypothetical protein